MNLKSASWNKLTDREERNIARMAAKARSNTIFGGASAMTFAKRLEAMGSKIDYHAIISDVYSSSTGKHSPIYEAWKCPECDQPHLGQDKAFACCYINEDDFELHPG